jgi:hypothetical protein
VFPQLGLSQGKERHDIELSYPTRELFAEDLEGDGRVELLVIGHDDQSNYYLQIVRSDP